MIDGQPSVTPALRCGARGTGSTGTARPRASLLRVVNGARVRLTCSLMDGSVLARSAFDHSVDCRSAMVFGTAGLTTDAAETEAALRAFADGLVPGRWDTLRTEPAPDLPAGLHLPQPLAALIASGRLR